MNSFRASRILGRRPWLRSSTLHLRALRDAHRGVFRARRADRGRCAHRLHHPGRETTASPEAVGAGRGNLPGLCVLRPAFVPVHARTPGSLNAAMLRAVKLVHTLAWAFFAGCIVLLPFAAWSNRFDFALALGVIVMVEVLILAFNGFRCPLTAVAAEPPEDRRDNFDIYLPLWLARYNKQIFGSLFAAGTIFTLI